MVVQLRWSNRLIQFATIATARGEADVGRSASAAKQIDGGAIDVGDSSREDRQSAQRRQVLKLVRDRVDPRLPKLVIAVWW